MFRKAIIIPIVLLILGSGFGACNKEDPTKAMITVPLERPLNPSMMLMALATPPTAKAVNTTETSVKPNR